MSKAKHIVRQELDRVSPADLDGSLGQAVRRLQELIDVYGKDAYFDWQEDFYYPYSQDRTPTYFIYKNREETDEEQRLRIVLEQQREEARTEKDRETYERLKKTFGDK